MDILNKIDNVLNEVIDKKLWALGRQVNDNLPPESGMKPSKEQLKVAAKKLGIPLSKATKAFNVFMFDY